MWLKPAVMALQIFRFFHGRSQAAGTILDEFTNLHPQMSRQTSLREQLVR